MDRQTTEKQITEFIGKLESSIHPEKVILFGSRARGNNWKHSDYDFIIVSKQFSGVHWLDRISQVIRLWDPLESIDILPYTPEEFEDKKLNSSVVRTAVREGKILIAN